MSAGSLRERVVEALHDHGLCVELPGEEGAHEVGTAPCHRFADAVLAEARAWLGSDEVAGEIDRAFYVDGDTSGRSFRSEQAGRNLATLIDKTKEVEA